jgi:hypothetical protein
VTREIPAVGPHPLVDVGGDGLLIWESRSDVIGISPAAVNVLGRARDAGTVAILVTDEVTALTPAFAEFWRQGGGAWVVRGTDRVREGFSGRVLSSVEAVLTTDPAASADDVDVSYLRPVPATALELSIVTSLRHRPTRAALLGGPIEGAAAVTGSALTAWGAHEPATTAWDRPTFTEYARAQMPQDTLVIASGPGVVGTVTVRRTSAGVEELTTASANLATPSTVAFGALLDRLDAHLAELGVGMPLIGFATVRPSARPLLVTATLASPPTPLRLLIGPPGIKLLKLKVDEVVERFGAERIGRPRLPGLLFRLGTLGDPTWLRLDEILGSFDRTLLDAALGHSPYWARAGGDDGR